jgi:hypothetical protein
MEHRFVAIRNGVMEDCLTLCLHILFSHVPVKKKFATTKLQIFLNSCKFLNGSINVIIIIIILIIIIIIIIIS